MPDETQDNSTDNQTTNGTDEQDQITWEGWLEGQEPTIQGLYEGHVQGLKAALASERDQGKNLAKELREATLKLEEGSEARKELEKLQITVDTATQRADFFEEAARPEIGCANPKLAFVAAKEIDAFDKRGNVNWERLRESFPELFKPKGAPGHAGAGTTTAPQPIDMNAIIRGATGRQ